MSKPRTAEELEAWLRQATAIEASDFWAGIDAAIRRDKLTPAWSGTEWYGSRIADETSATMHPTAVYERQKAAKEQS